MATEIVVIVLSLLSCSAVYYPLYGGSMKFGVCVIIQLLRTVPTFVTVHTFCASQDTQVPYGWCQYRDIFARFKTMRRKQNLASALGIQKEKGG